MCDFQPRAPCCLVNQVRRWKAPNPLWAHDLISTRVSKSESQPITTPNISVDLALTPQQMPKPATPTPGSSPSQVRKTSPEAQTQATRGHRYPDFPHNPVTSLNLASSLQPCHLNPTPLRKGQLRLCLVRWGKFRVEKDSSLSFSLRGAHSPDPAHPHQNLPQHRHRTSHRVLPTCVNPQPQLNHSSALPHPKPQSRPSPAPTQQDPIHHLIPKCLPSATQPYPPNQLSHHLQPCAHPHPISVLLPECIAFLMVSSDPS